MAQRVNGDKRHLVDIDPLIRAEIRARRIELDMSQTKLGELVGLTRNSIAAAENGDGQIDEKHLLKICRILSVKLPKPQQLEPEDEEQMAQLNDVMRALSREERAALLVTFARHAAKRGT